MAGNALKREIASVEKQIAHLQRKLESLREHLHRNNSCIRLREVARMFGVSCQTVIRMIGDGRLDGRQSCKKGWWWITKRSLKKFERDLLSKRATIRFH